MDIIHLESNCQIERFWMNRCDKLFIGIGVIFMAFVSTVFQRFLFVSHKFFLLFLSLVYFTIGKRNIRSSHHCKKNLYLPLPTLSNDLWQLC
jgi:hypothetical protein